MKIKGEIFKIGKRLRDRTIFINRFHGKIVIHNVRPDSYVEILAGLSKKDRAELGRLIKEKSFHKEERV